MPHKLLRPQSLASRQVGISLVMHKIFAGHAQSYLALQDLARDLQEVQLTA